MSEGSFGLLDSGSGTVDVRSGGVVDALESLEGIASGGVGLVDELVDASLGSVDGGAAVNEMVTLTARGLSNLLDSVLDALLGDDVESLLLLDDSATADLLTSTLDGDGGSGLRSVVESRVVQGVLGPHVGVELNEVGVVTLGQLPDKVLRDVSS